MAAMLCDVFRCRRRRRWAPAHVIYAASHFYHEKIVAWAFVFMHACDPIPIVMGLRLVTLRAAGAPLLKRLPPFLAFLEWLWKMKLIWRIYREDS